MVSLEDGNSITVYTNVDEWAESSGILPYEFYARNNVDKVCESSMPGYNAYIPVYNAGDVDAPFYLFLPFCLFLHRRQLPGALRSRVETP